MNSVLSTVHRACLQCKCGWLTGTFQPDSRHICACPGVRAEMHPEKLRDWNQQNTKLVFVYPAAATANGPERFDIRLTDCTEMAPSKIRTASYRRLQWVFGNIVHRFHRFTRFLSLIPETQNNQHVPSGYYHRHWATPPEKVKLLDCAKINGF